jgi:hypothetical protein
MKRMGLREWDCDFMHWIPVAGHSVMFVNMNKLDEMSSQGSSVVDLRFNWWICSSCAENRCAVRLSLFHRRSISLLSFEEGVEVAWTQ